MTTDALVEKYREHLVALHRAAKTIHIRVVRSHKFMTFAESRGVRHAASVTAGTILDYQKHLADELNAYGRANTVSVQNQCLSAVAGFFGLSPSGRLSPTTRHAILNMPARPSACPRRSSRRPRSRNCCASPISTPPSATVTA